MQLGPGTTSVACARLIVLFAPFTMYYDPLNKFCTSLQKPYPELATKPNVDSKALGKISPAK